MILQMRFTLIYRIVLETSGANSFRIVELHWRDFAVFVSLSSRTNTRQGCACAMHWREAGAREHVPILS
jgi:trehalose utilization protein